MFQRNFKLSDFHVYSVCFLQNFFFRSEQKFPSVLYHFVKFQKFAPSVFRDIFDRNLNFPKISRVQERYLHMRKPGALVRTTYSISSLKVVSISRDSVAVFSSTGHAHQKAISSHLKNLRFMFPTGIFLAEGGHWGI